MLRPGGRLYLYDFRRAPSEILDSAAGRKGLLAGEPVHYTVIRAGWTGGAGRAQAG